MKPDRGMHFASYYRWLVIRDWIRVSPDARVLDVGCDDGEIIARISAVSRIAIDRNSPRCPDASVRLIQGDAYHLPLASGSVDAMFAFDIIEHIDDDRGVLAELVRVLANNGTLWISVPSAGFALFPPFLTARANKGWKHIRGGYTLEEIQEKLPAGTHVEIMPWNEPAFRFTYAVLRIFGESTQLTYLLARWCFEIDRHWCRGHYGHWFCRVRKRAISTWV